MNDRRFRTIPGPCPFPEAAGDWRAFENARPRVSLDSGILPSGYGYMEGLSRFEVSDRVHLRALTVARCREGHPSQHIIVQRSTDGGASWGEWFNLEPEGPPMTTYGSFFRHPKTGRIVFMYLRGPEEDLHYDKQATDFLDAATFLGWWDGEPFRCYPHLIGRVVYRYVDGEGVFSGRHELRLPVSGPDLVNPFRGKYSVMYSVPAPRRMDGADGIGWTSQHGPVPRTGNGAGVFFRYKNYANEDRLENLEIECFPYGGRGVAHPQYSNAGDFGPLAMEEDYWCFRHRTIHGFLGLAVSRDRGRNWTHDLLRYEPGGRPIKCPQGPFGFPKDPRGRGFFTWYNVSARGFDEFAGRDLVFVSRVRTDGRRLTFSQPELVHYRRDHLGYASHSHERLNPPSLGAATDDGAGVRCGVSDKESLREFVLPMAFLDMLDAQESLCGIPQDGLLAVRAAAGRPAEAGSLPALSPDAGFSLTATLCLGDPQPGRVLLEAGGDGRGLALRVGEHGGLRFEMGDGRRNAILTSDAGALRAGERQAVSVLVDGAADVISMVVDGRFQDGGAEKDRGVCRIPRPFDYASLGALRVFGEGLRDLAVHGRPLFTTEAIAAQRALRAGKD